MFFTEPLNCGLLLHWDLWDFFIWVVTSHFWLESPSWSTLWWYQASTWLCHPGCRKPTKVPCSTVLEREASRVTWPNQDSFFFLIVARRGSWRLACVVISDHTKLFVLLYGQETPSRRLKHLVSKACPYYTDLINWHSIRLILKKK